MAIKGLSIEFTGESSGLQKAIGDINKKSRDVQSELRKVDRLLKLDPKNTALVAQKQKLLKDAVANTTDKLNRLRAAQAQVDAQFKKGQINEEQYREFQREVIKSEQDLRKLDAQLARTKRSLADYGDKMVSTGRSMTIGITLPLLALGALAVKTAAEYEQALTNAVSVTGLMGSAADKAEGQMNGLALQLGRETAFSAKEAADAMYDLASSGWSAGQMADGLRGIMDLAAATQSDLAFTTDLVTSTLAQFGLEAKDSGRIADVFTATIGSTKANMEKLALSMRYVGPIAKSLGWSVEHTSAILGKLFDAGFKGEQAGTALRGSLAMLMKPSNDAAAAIEELHLNIEDLNPATHKYDQILEKLHSRQMNANQAVRIFGVEAAPAVLALANMSKGGKDGAQMIGKLEGELEKAGGRAKSVAENQLDTLTGQLKILQGSAETMAITFGTIVMPALQSMAEATIPMLNALAEMGPTGKMAVLSIAGIAAAAGPLLYVSGKVILLRAALATAGVQGGVLSGSLQLVGVSAARASGAIKILTTSLVVMAKAAFVAWAAYAVGSRVTDSFTMAAQKVDSQAKKTGKNLSSSARDWAIFTTAAGTSRNELDKWRKKSGETGTSATNMAAATKAASEQIVDAEEAVVSAEQDAAVARFAIYTADEAVRNELTARIKESTSEQIKAFDDAQQKLYDWVGVFDEVPEKLKISGAELTKRLQEQNSRFAEWEANIKSLVGRIPPTMLAELAKMGPGAAGEIQGLAEMSQPGLDAYAALWQTKHQNAINKSLEALAAGTEPLAAQAQATINGSLNATATAGGWGQSVGNAWVMGIETSILRNVGALDPALDSFYKSMEGKSPPKTGPLKNIDKSGFNVGKAWVDNLVAAIGTTASRLSGSLGTVQSSLAGIGGNLVPVPLPGQTSSPSSGGASRVVSVALAGAKMQIVDMQKGLVEFVQGEIRIGISNDLAYAAARSRWDKPQ